jgi:predicted dehydrogenase
VVSGLCLRFDAGFKETVKRIHGGAIGDVVTLFANDYRGGRWEKKRQPDWSDMTYHMRNWYNFTWLSGDFNVEQHVHFLDVCSWVMKEQYPTKAIGMGGRGVLTGAEYGNIYDHFSIVYEYANGARLVSNTRQHPKTKGDMSAVALGTKGKSLLSERTNGLTIKSDKEDWVYEGPFNEMYQVEHDELFASIRNSKPINNGEYMCNSTLLAIMGRMAAYTGAEITWKMALDSKEDLFKGVLGVKNDEAMPSYDWKTKLIHPLVAVPGIAKFV